MTTALEEEAKKLREELEEQLAKESGLEEDLEEEEVQAPEPEEEPEEEKLEQKEPEPEPEKEPEEKLDNSAYARMRREKDAEKRRADQLKQEIDELKRRLDTREAPSQEQEQSYVPQTDYELEQIKLEKRYNDAEKVVMRLEQEFKDGNAFDDYDDVTAQYKALIYNSVRVNNTDASHAELLDMTRKKLLEIAAQHDKNGYNPIERIYLDAKKMGFKSLPKQEQAKEVEVRELKPDLSKIAANKKRNAGTAGAKGAGDRGQMTPQAMAELPAHEYAKLPESERRRVLESLRYAG